MSGGRNWDDAPERARELAGDAVELFNAGSFDDAARLFARAAAVCVEDSVAGGTLPADRMRRVLKDARRMLERADLALDFRGRR